MLQQLSCKNEIHLGRGFAHGEVLVCAVVWCSASGNLRPLGSQHCQLPQSVGIMLPSAEWRGRKLACCVIFTVFSLENI